MGLRDLDAVDDDDDYEGDGEEDEGEYLKNKTKIIEDKNLRIIYCYQGKNI